MKTVACIIQPHFSPFEFGIACEVFGLDRSDDGIPKLDFRVLTAEPGVVPSKMGFSVNVEHDLSFAHEADVVVVCPFPREMWDTVDERVIDAIRAADARGAWIVSECSGVFALAAAGVLDGRRATTHWMYAGELARRYPQIDVNPDVLFVHDDHIITSAGTAAGIDACLSLLRIELGAETTNRIARRMVVPPQRDGGQAQFIDRPIPYDADASLAPIATWAVGNLRDDLSVERLAAHAHMSPRTFARRFKAEYGATPAAWLTRQRLIQAQRMLERTDLAIEQIAEECGFGSAAVLRQNFARVLDTTPTAYRARFSCADEAEMSIA
ncbi:GlxA family transcriptional regulator [Microbacterium keratanolyticum]|uniref:GlxA family transcriptional regulator n=1 Tax=Microbacterium keratanolyticum TaxID=67574 RepID=UPI00362E6DFD